MNIYRKVYLQHFGLIVYHLKRHKYNYKYVLWMWPYFYLYIYVIMEENLLWYEHLELGDYFTMKISGRKIQTNEEKKRVIIGETQGSWRVCVIFGWTWKCLCFFFCRSFIYFTSSLCYGILISLDNSSLSHCANKIAWPTSLFLWPFSDG